MITTAVFGLIATLYLFLISRIFHFKKFSSIDQSSSLAWRPPIVINNLAQVFMGDIFKAIFILAWEIVLIQIAFFMISLFLEIILQFEVSNIVINLISLFMVIIHTSFAIEYRFKREKMKYYSMF
jgi:hypothetical protein